MRAIRRTDTKPEVSIRSALHQQGYRFRKDYLIRTSNGVRARPDIVFTKQRVVVFVDGCFWHCCPEHGRSPQQNTSYWRPKLARNIERDRQQDAALRAAGWTVVRVWEHESVNTAAAEVIARL